MIITRRRALEAGGGFLAALLLRPPLVIAAEPIEIVMAGKPDGSHVWFNPVGIQVSPGQTIRWSNRDPGNVHTTTSYHPDIDGRTLRIPPGAQPWQSDYLMPDQSFEVTLTMEGVYDYYCIPHEHAGMVGRIVVGSPPPDEPPSLSSEDAKLTPPPEVALSNFPTVAAILQAGRVPPD